MIATLDNESHYQAAGEARLDAERFASIGYLIAAARQDRLYRQHLEQVRR